MIDRILALLALLGSGLVTGVFFAVAVSTVPALMAMPPGRYIYAHKLLGRNWDPAMPIIVLTATFAAAGWAIGAASPAVRVSAAVVTVLMLGVSGVSHLCNVPINKRMRAVDPDAVPADWADPRPIWRRWHLLRTALAVGAFLLTSVAATWT
ncbi:anthrone oxygenase family protein [Plantactinospora siamensis]|uniref:Anthrone oxygenase family protein n=1 Tax=Plantactinospora siamensis TaxID=555372 RepID=A0ABV6NXR0_9ACTN